MEQKIPLKVKLLKRIALAVNFDKLNIYFSIIKRIK